VLRVENLKKYYEIHDSSLLALIRGAFALVPHG
jgi:hypothetical protein